VIIAAWIASAVALVWLMVRAIVLGVARGDAADMLEKCMDRGNAEHVRSLLIVRGHLLRKDVREAATSWLVERDNEKDG
jgi:hypothetical protein